jgi:hypothetical protein
VNVKRKAVNPAREPDRTESATCDERSNPARKVSGSLTLHKPEQTGVGVPGWVQESNLHISRLPEKGGKGACSRLVIE